MATIINTHNHPVSLELTKYTKDGSVDKRYGKRELHLKQGENPDVDPVDLKLAKETKAGSAMFASGKLSATGEADDAKGEE